VLIGDARHAISPVTGRGANLALEDASVLAAMLQDARPEDIPAILQKFGAARTGRIEPLRKHLRQIEALTMVRSPILAAARNAFFAAAPMSVFIGKPNPRFI
jgi:2-polyprenyl-6-methoxyphenol hydroxylase-like FAD-dependent oxidoreductase